MPLKQKPDADRLFRELAGRYAELEGHALRQELGSRVTPVFPPELDRRIRRSTRGGSDVYKRQARDGLHHRLEPV